MLIFGAVKIRRRWLWTLVALAGVVTIALVVVASAVPFRSETLKRRIVESLSDRLNADVTLETLSLRAFPRLHAEGGGLRIRKRDQPADIAPLIAIDRFTVNADLAGVVRKHVAHVELGGLVISIPPGPEGDDHPEDRLKHRLHPPTGAVATTGDAGNNDKGDRKPHLNPTAIEGGVVIDRLDTTDAKLVIIPRQADKAPKTWAIHTLTMHTVGVHQAMPFEATLTNGVPPGEIVTRGTFGPWGVDDPGSTPLEGTFTFDNANLDVFPGIGGMLSSKGTFGGSLEYIETNGETETPDFVIDVSGHKFPLHTKYHAIVDGTNGDTRLEQIDARFLHSTLTAKGAVLDGPPGQKGRTVTLDITMPQARIEDVMLMAIKSKAPMNGALTLTTKFLLPPGENDVVDRLKLNGRFAITRAKFVNYDVQGKIVELSYRGRGKKDDPRTEAVASDFKGRFIFGSGRLDLPDVTFGVPGAQVKLAGNYVVKPETLDFKGSLSMDAKVSQTVSGFKSLLLKAADPLFKREGGGSEIPIKIEGTRNEPKFGLDLRRVFKKSG